MFNNCEPQSSTVIVILESSSSLSDNLYHIRHRVTPCNADSTNISCEYARKYEGFPSYFKFPVFKLCHPVSELKNSFIRLFNQLIESMGIRQTTNRTISSMYFL